MKPASSALPGKVDVMSTGEYRAATAGKLARIEENPRFVVLKQLRAGINAVNEAIRSTNRADQRVLCLDAKHAYDRALDVMTQAQSVLGDPIVQRQFAHLETLLRRIDSPPE